MGLIDLKTDLKSLKYGKDRLGGGDSGQPYIQTSIDGLDVIARANEDGLIRGGRTAATKSSDIDSIRIGKFLDSSKGKLFITKQVGLQFSNPKLETRKINIGGTNSGILGFISNVANTLNTTFGPTRIYNLGVNTLAQIPVNAFGTHFNRHGLTPVQDDETKYLTVARFNNENGGNRLVGYTSKFKLGDRIENEPSLISKTSKFLSKASSLLTQIGSLLGGRISRTTSRIARAISFINTDINLEVDNYVGGPGSTYGIGKTIIRRYDNTEDDTRISAAFEKSTLKSLEAKINWSNVLSVSTGINPSSGNVGNSNPKDGEFLNSIPANSVSPAFKSYQKLTQTVNNLPTEANQRVGSLSLHNSRTNNITKDNKNFYYYGKGKVSSDSSRITYNNTNTFSRTDSNILTVGFRIVNPFDLDEDTIVLSAYMNGFKDGFNATWNETNYVGRAESFYIYQKYKRTVSFNLQIPCFNKDQLFKKHRALGQLSSVTAGNYNKNGLLGGVLIKLNVGNYLIGEYGILNSLDYSIPPDATWDTTPEGLLSMYIDASFNFTIVHKDLPTYDAGEGFFKYLPKRSGDYSYRNKDFVYVPNVDESEQERKDRSWTTDRYGALGGQVVSTSTGQLLQNLFTRKDNELFADNISAPESIEELPNNNFIGPLP